ncbi:MAG: hypothetical protein JO307_09870 [Bryobacterales bacterium]|nr:hypothetical protein [Bryobacterales bacterium]MBV9400153.1 hypothetical protein [Bryobacterales bacterium]
MKKPVLLGIVFGLIVLGYIVYSSMNLAGHKVEVCITFNGRTNCRTASGASEEFARRTATTNACADIASGVTDSIACENTPPNSVKILK